MSCNHRSSGLLRIILLIVFILSFWRQILLGIVVYLFVTLLTMMIQWTMIHPWLALSIALSLIGVFCLLPIKKMRQALTNFLPPMPAERTQQSENLMIKANYQLIQLKTDDILFIKALADYVIIKPFTDRKISLIEKFIGKYGTYRPENKIIKKVNDVLEWVIQVKNNQNSDTFIKI